MPEFKHLSSESSMFLIFARLRQIWKILTIHLKPLLNSPKEVGLLFVVVKKELKKFYDLHLSIVKGNIKIFPQPYRFFEVIWEETSRKVMEFAGAYSPNGNFIVGTFILCGDSFYYKFITSSLFALKYRPNNLLFWEGLYEGS